ncbi:MAG: ATP-binding protein [Bifidobacterium sp.]
MTFTEEIIRLSTMPEGQRFDRKSARIRPDSLTRHVIAFANAAGGRLAIGIEDDGSVTGFRQENAQRIADLERIPVAQCEPSPVVTAHTVPCINVRGDRDVVLVLDVEASAHRVIARRDSGEVYLRESDNSVLLTPDEAHELEREKGQRKAEEGRGQQRTAKDSKGWQRMAEDGRG